MTTRREEQTQKLVKAQQDYDSGTIDFREFMKVVDVWMQERETTIDEK